MKIFQNGAEYYLYEQIKTIDSSHEKWRAIHFTFSKLDAVYTSGLRTHIVVNILKDLMQGFVGFVYLCEDNDIVILFQGMARPVLDKLGDHVYGMLNTRHAALPDESGLCRVYDMAVAWPAFRAMVEDKYSTYKMHSQAERKAIGQLNHPSKPHQWQEPALEEAKLRRDERSRLLVLIVEDDPFTRRLVGNALRPTYDVIEAADGKEALTLYNDFAPDMVFQDIELPDSNGHLLLKEMVQHYSHAFVVMLSGNSSKENVIAALEDGAQGFVAKPFPKDKLLHYMLTCDKVKAQRLGRLGSNVTPIRQEA